MRACSTVHATAPHPHNLDGAEDAAIRARAAIGVLPQDKPRWIFAQPTIDDPGGLGSCPTGGGQCRSTCRCNRAAAAGLSDR